MNPITSFEDFDLDPDVLDGIDAMNYKSPTPIQQQAIPIILAGHDLIACAQTGTGKTAAFVLPLLDSILQADKGGINTLILVPTRELAIQIDQQIEAMSYYADVSSVAVYGGSSGATWNQQQQALRQGTDVVIATPGRLIQMMSMGSLSFASLKHLVLDEADRMLDMGFYDDIMRIVSQLPAFRQTLCFSATMPPRMRQLANTILTNPQSVSIAMSKPAAGITQQAYVVHEDQKLKLLRQILKAGDYKSSIIFCSTKDKVKSLESEVRRAGFNARAFSSDLEQEEREVLMQAFRNRQMPLLIGTDVLSRGIDVEGIELVLNYDVPPDPEDYVHRVGRTARAERTGTAITFVSSKDMQRFGTIEKMIGYPVDKMPLPEGFEPGPDYDPERKDRSSGGGFGRGGKSNSPRGASGGHKRGRNGKPQGGGGGGKHPSGGHNANHSKRNPSQQKSSQRPGGPASRKEGQ